jgi:anti-anti-sigma factor
VDGRVASRITETAAIGVTRAAELDRTKRPKFGLECPAMNSKNMPPLEVKSRVGKRAGPRIVEVSGRLVFENKEKLDMAVRKENDPVVILDLTGLLHVDSYGVGTLVRMHVSYKGEKHRLALVGLSEKVRHVLEITRVLPVFTVFDTVAEAEEKLV